MMSVDSKQECWPAKGESRAALPLLSVRNLEVGFAGRRGTVPVVRGIDFDVYPNEVLCIVGESGSGKSVTSLAVTGLLPDNAAVSGSVEFNGEQMIGADPERLRMLRGNDIGFIFQDPATTLNPVLPIGRQITEGQIAHGLLNPQDASIRAAALLSEVDIADPDMRVAQYPHQFSGGMRQRAVIAMAMAGKPKLIIADEPTTALDVTVQAQILSVLARRQEETGAAIVLITHDLGVVAEVADRVLVMYAAQAVETGPVGDIFGHPRMPYTAGLMGSIPRLGASEAKVRLTTIPGQVPSLARLPAGCRFAPRCAFAIGACRSGEPALVGVSPGHAARCIRAGDLDLTERVPA